MPVLVICKNEGDLKKIEAARVMTRFSHVKSMGAMCCHGSQSSTPISLKTLCIMTEILLKRTQNRKSSTHPSNDVFYLYVSLNIMNDL